MSFHELRVVKCNGRCYANNLQAGDNPSKIAGFVLNLLAEL